jgi:hypothetical protein
LDKLIEVNPKWLNSKNAKKKMSKNKNSMKMEGFGWRI